MSSKTVQMLGRRAVASAKAVKPTRGGHGHIPYENPALTGKYGPHPGKAGPNYGTTYFYVGDTPAKKFVVASVICGMLGGGVGTVLWTCSRQGQWSK
mmetsp:Transcript_8615/g.16746  ORF Transcript_8615/g.16746 Transcript_8615/m.16746 type:complete len:97 (-) Transcript_8615:75-365(-)|eukprot:CAMPEP_0173416256 /NCGR_PEP_ID=MMETSP1356-20130122/85299_1 /TAXON_ID=77927 ORGANISM="Hemiselmis virescens, Strain PCC157" /NCGR_SAMPLE_ID=MMETSP1356 /ASSEMBLY_ACC=CAM_ASM_000847 /LENGTH=96 /DNA_ID=CAMNT_0014378561 /DNA_START=12 /DNA_END=302 /DNA_ORIENTATION=+